MTMKIINEKPVNELLVEDIEWDEEYLKANHMTKKQSLTLYKIHGYDYKDLEYIGTIIEE